MTRHGLLHQGHPKVAVQVFDFKFCVREFPGSNGRHPCAVPNAGHETVVRDSVARHIRTPCILFTNSTTHNERTPPLVMLQIRQVLR